MLPIVSGCRACWRLLAKLRAFVAFNKDCFFLIDSFILFLFFDKMPPFLSSLGLFFFFFSLPKDTSLILSYVFYSWEKAFQEQITSTCGFCVRDVNKICKWNETAANISLGGSPIYEIVTPSWFINFYLEIRFSKEVGSFLRFLNLFFCKR